MDISVVPYGTYMQEFYSSPLGGVSSVRSQIMKGLLNTTVADKHTTTLCSRSAFQLKSDLKSLHLNILPAWCIVHGYLQTVLFASELGVYMFIVHICVR